MKDICLKIAIQKSGRLSEDSLKLLKDCGISIDNGKEQDIRVSSPALIQNPKKIK